MIALERTRTRFILAPSQRQTIDKAADALPEGRRHSFRLRASRILEMSRGTNGFVTDRLVEKAISVGMEETEMRARLRARRGSGHPPYVLSVRQWDQVDAAERTLPTAPARLSFQRHVSALLRSAAPIGEVPDELLDRCIDRAMREVST